MEEGNELKEIKSITTKLCDCLQVLSSTHTDVNERFLHSLYLYKYAIAPASTLPLTITITRPPPPPPPVLLLCVPITITRPTYNLPRYEMEDTVDQVKGTVNQILLMRPGDLEDSVEDWLNSMNSVTSHLDTFLKPLLDIVSSPKNKDVFSTSAERITKLVESVTEITSDLQLGVDLNLITDEKERDGVELVNVTQDHVTKMTPALCDAIQVVSSRPNDTLQRTKFEAVKYQWATKFRLLNIAIGDILGSHSSFPEFPDRKDCWVVEEDVERLLTSVYLISDKLSDCGYKDLVYKHINKLGELRGKMSTVHLMDPDQYMQLRTDITFAVYCIHSAVITTCSAVTDLVPELPADLVDSIECDPVTLSDTADDAIDMITTISDRVEAEGGDQEKVQKMRILSSSLIETLVLISDQPSTEVPFIIFISALN